MLAALAGAKEGEKQGGRLESTAHNEMVNTITEARLITKEMGVAKAEFAS